MNPTINDHPMKVVVVDEDGETINDHPLVVTPVGGGGGGNPISVQEDDAEVVEELATLNFEGAGVSVTDDGSGKATVTISGGGGSGTPGGSDTELQFNDNGAFNGTPGLVYDGTDVIVMNDLQTDPNNPTLIGAGHIADVGTSAIAGVIVSRDGVNTPSTGFITAEADGTTIATQTVSPGQVAFTITDGNGSNNVAMSSQHITSDVYPDTRDDTGTQTPSNFLYTDGAGTLMSAPLAWAGGGSGWEVVNDQTLGVDSPTVSRLGIFDLDADGIVKIIVTGINSTSGNVYLAFNGNTPSSSPSEFATNAVRLSGGSTSVFTGNTSLGVNGTVGMLEMTLTKYGSGDKMKASFVNVRDDNRISNGYIIFNTTTNITGFNFGTDGGDIKAGMRTFVTRPS